MPEPFDLTGKTAIVTGGAGILGRGFCAALVASGANVAVVDVAAEAAEEVAREIGGSSSGARAASFGCDVSDPESVARMVSAVQACFGSVQVLVNNAATKTADPDAFFARFEEYELAEWRRVMSVNLDGMFLVAQAVGRLLVRQEQGGSIIQTASVYGVVAPDPRIYAGSSYQGRPINTPAVYSASKAGVIGLTRYLAAYWGPQRIRVNALTPGGVSSGQNETFQRLYGARVPLGRMAERTELQGAVVFLASDAASYVTGQNLIVDGGLTCW
ncbi:MAG: SDR family oxidoreductase [Vicinamibacteria bacterium]